MRGRPVEIVYSDKLCRPLEAGETYVDGLAGAKGFSLSEPRAERVPEAAPDSDVDSSGAQTIDWGNYESM